TRIRQPRQRPRPPQGNSALNGTRASSRGVPYGTSTSCPSGISRSRATPGLTTGSADGRQLLGELGGGVGVGSVAVGADLLRVRLRRGGAADQDLDVLAQSRVGDRLD